MQMRSIEASKEQAISSSSIARTKVHSVSQLEDMYNNKRHHVGVGAVVGMIPSSYLVIVGASLAAGYFVGRVVPNQRSAGPPTEPEPEPESEGDGDSDAESVDRNGDLSQVKAGIQEECKMILVVRNDLGMSIGKIAAQCSHATLACYKALSLSNPALLRHWEHTGQTKIVMKCVDEAELLSLQAQAQSLNLCTRSIQDAGRTQVAAGSRTVLGIGPGPMRLISKVTEPLEML